MSDDEKRELAGYVAPIVRGTSETVLRRPVKTYDRETGEVTGEVTMRQVLGGLTEVTALEIEVIDGRRPKQFTCEGCGKVFEMPKKGALRRMCDVCRALACIDCGVALSRTGLHRGSTRCVPCAGVARRKPRRCGTCGVAVTKSGVQCRECSFVARRKALPSCRACGTTLSPSARVQSISLCRPCWRSSHTTEQRSGWARKAWETRRARAAVVLSSQHGGEEKTGADD